MIGADVAAKLFDGIDPVGHEIRAGQGRYEIVGVAAPKGSVLGQTQDNFVMIPLGTYRKEWLAPQDSVQIFVEARSRQEMSTAVDEARVILRARRHVPYAAEDNFGIIEPSTLMGIWDNLTANIFGVAVWVTSVFLVVGGIVIMNIMLASVTERTREIGLRKSLGARRRHIVMQFLVESSLLAASGRAVGDCHSAGSRRAGALRHIHSNRDTGIRGGRLAAAFHQRRAVLRHLSSRARGAPGSHRSTARGSLAHGNTAELPRKLRAGD